MKTFEHRAPVKAARILRIDSHERPFMACLEGGAVEPMSLPSWESAAKDVLSGNPIGYLVFHQDHRVSYAPKARFEAEFMEIRATPIESAPIARMAEALPEPPPRPVTAMTAPKAEPKPAANPAPPEPTRKDRTLDRYAATTLGQSALAKELGMSVGSVSGFISLGRSRGDARVIRGDAARKAAKPAPPPPSVRVETQPAPAVAAVPAPAPRAAARPIAPTAKNAVPENARAASATRERVLDHYKATGDYEAPMAQKLGVLRATVASILADARAAGDQRTRLGDIKRKAKERGK